MKIASLFTKNILSLDIGAYEVKVVEGKETKDGIRVDNYFSLLTPENTYNDGKIIDKSLLHYTLSEGFKSNNVKAKDLHLSINNPSIITREVVIPKVEEKDIKDVLEFQLDDYIPINPERYIVQYKTIENFLHDDVEKLSILLIAIPREIIEDHLQLIRDLELNPLVLDYQPNSIAKLIQYNNSINGEYTTKDKTFAIVDIGYDNTKVFITKNEKILVSRIIENGGRSMEVDVLDENIINNFFQVLNRKIDLIFRYFLSRRIGNKIDMLLLIGGTSKIDGIKELFSNNFDIPLVMLESFDRIFLGEQVYKYINAVGAIIRTAGV